jgi:hypothetical protein
MNAKYAKMKEVDDKCKELRAELDELTKVNLIIIKLRLVMKPPKMLIQQFKIKKMSSSIK